MGAIFSGLLTVVLGVGGLALFLSGLYWLTHFLPDRFQELGRVLVFVGPAVVLVCIGLVVPAGRTILTSFYDDNGVEFVGLENYTDIFSNTNTRLTVFNSLMWVLFGTTITVIIGLTVARFADNVTGEKAIKSLIFIPGAISLVGAGTIWLFVYAAPPFKVGLLNQVMGGIPGVPESMGGNGDRAWVLERGFGGLEPPFDSAPGFNTFLLIVIFIWASTGFATVVFSAAIKGVPESLIEAAKVDGATDRQAFYKVTLPYIRATIITVATTTTIGALKAFDIVAAMTGGRFRTSTLANEFYTTKFVQGIDGKASALAVIIFVLVVPVVVLNRRSQARAEEMMAA